MTYYNWHDSYLLLFFKSTLLERRQTLRKPSNADEPLRKVALAKLKKEEERKDPLRAVS